MQWPPDYKVEIEKRLARLRRMKSDPLYCAKLMLYYKHHPADWINDWCVTFDPRKPDLKLMPFILFPRQREYIQFLDECLRDKAPGSTEKCRDVGATWLASAWSAHRWKFWEGSIIGWGSRKEEYVDKKGDPKAIFPKIRQIIEYLPKLMLPDGFDMRKHSKHMVIENPENGSAITGEAGDNIGRGGRTTVYFKDESAHYEHPELIEAALGDNTDVQQDISSVNGTATVFYRKNEVAELWEPGKVMTPGKTRLFIFDWMDHPAKTQEWFEARRKKAEEEGLLHIFNQEVCRDSSGSVDKIIIPALWVNASVDAHIKLKFKPSGEKVAGQDIADGGGDKNAYVSRHGIVMRRAEHWAGEAPDAARVCMPYAIDDSINELQYDSIGVGSGFKGEVNTMKREGTWPKRLKVVPWNAGGEVQDPEKNIIPNDKESPKNEDQYLNLKAQSWFRMRARFYKTYRVVTHGDKYDEAELISIDSTIPKRMQLQREFSQAVYKPSANGKTMVDKKADGALSPNLADAAVICYNPVRKPIGFFDV